jgi:predicted ArsR family transcriptional regulator
MGDERAKHSQRKVQVLKLLEGSEGMSAGELAERCGTSESNIRSVLSRARKASEVESRGSEFKPGAGQTRAEYHLTDRGRRRLEYERGG